MRVLNEELFRSLPVELEGLAALLRREAQKRDQLLSELRRFTADASHELRTPLSALRTVGEVALRGNDVDPAVLPRTTKGGCCSSVLELKREGEFKCHNN